MKSKVCVQYGCGFSNPKGWINYDASPTLRLQRIPLFGSFLKLVIKPNFPNNIHYGDIVKGLPLKPNSADLLYCSHVLEHLSHDDFEIALKNSYDCLKKGGVFRLVMPELNSLINTYIQEKNKKINEAPINFLTHSHLGVKESRIGLINRIKASFSNAKHQWLWDFEITKIYLEKVGFSEIRRVNYNDSEIIEFNKVENSDRFKNALAIQAIK